MYKFSVITPVHLWSQYRVDMFLRTIESLRNQTFKNFQWIVIDDGSTMPFRWEILAEKGFVPGENLILVHRPHEERVIAYNDAFQLAQGEWFALLDSDDEYKPNTLKRLDEWITKYPEDKMFNYGVAYIHTDGKITYRDPFSPEREKVGHVKFGGGNIVNGSFIFHRSIYDELGAYPQAKIKNIDCSEINYHDGDGKTTRDLYMGTPYDFSAAAQLQFPEIREFFMVPDEEKGWKVIKELGNPWGQDFYLFYKYTRKYHSRVIKEYLYLVHPR